MSVAPEIVKVFFGQSSHWVSEPAEQSAVLYFPDSHVAQVEHPAAPSALLSPAPQTEQVSAPPTEKVPAAQFSTLSREEEGFFPADAVLQTLALSTSEYFPSLLHSVQAVDSPPMDAVPLRQSPHWVSVSVVQSVVL